MSNTTDDRWNTARQDLANAAARAGVDPGVLAKIAGFESQYNPHARPIASHKHAELNSVTQFDGVKAMSSAYGYGQFTNDTWTGMVRQYGEKYGVIDARHLTEAQANAPELRNDTTLQAGMLAEFTRENIVKGAWLGGADADANVYALHNLGGAGGAAFLKAVREHPNERVDAVLSANVIKRNPGLYGDGTGTVEAAYTRMGQQMERYEHYAEDIRHVTPSQTAAASLSKSQPASSPHVQEPPHATPTHATRPADVLREGAHGEDVHALQERLEKLGYTGVRNTSLHVDGHYGPVTRNAVEAFQRDHHLTPDGVAGPLTMKQLDNQFRLHAHDASAKTQGTPLLNDPAHANNALFQQTMAGVRTVDQQQGRSSDQHSENLAAALTVAAQGKGLSKVDHVVMSDDGSRAWAVQGNIDSPFKQMASVDVAKAVNTPVAQSTEALAQTAKVAPDAAQQPAMQVLQPSAEGPHR
ncbi:MULTISPECIES: XVIPCD domain-containing protein [unclassified Dyella]|uniref:XVIPCD domain-containing protein n=1 Tax=unclassified Dyella TaxID=2634549 RepID=UPI000C852E45|nr:MULTISPECIES: XVIPCD domain-containing protein [unclassified Dyella]MDR3444981.1 peptidoglycan-binding protein [Dyella sp.]PMQ05062.1 Zinc D-Ala-D-Ala carboxypeptidase [Dyella sp. AD56]